MGLVDTNHFLIRALLAEKAVTDAEVERAMQHSRAHACTPVDSLVALGIVGSRAMAIIRAKLCEYPFVDLGAFEIDIRNATRLARGVAERLGAFPLFIFEGKATVAMYDPLNLQAIDQVRQVLKCEVDPVLCDAVQLKGLIARAYSMAAASGEGETEGEKELTTGDEPIVVAVNQILAGAAEAGASDVHINPDENVLHLRYRMDGVLHGQQGPPKSMHAGLVQRLKVMAQLDLTQTRKPQDGKLRFVHRGEPVDVRLSILPTVHGENVVMRLLRSGTKIGKMDDLGMPAEVLAWYKDAIARPHGMILVTGPTGSGKTTTLYTALAALNAPERNVLTIEDPVEIRLPLIRQVQVNSEIGLTFASALRSILRQDPDVVLVGEIRDQETAKIAVQAAMTGHLVLSTLHTNDAVGALARLRNFDLPTFAVNQALLCVIAQRLVRRTCSDCVRPAAAPDIAMLRELGIDAVGARSLREGGGCGRCSGTGYRGRAGVYEMLRMTPGIQRLFEKDAPEFEIAAQAAREGMQRMLADGIEKALRGITTLAEVGKLRSAVECEPETTARQAA